jgi:hypothetical protein
MGKAKLEYANGWLEIEDKKAENVLFISAEIVCVFIINTY